MEAALLQKYLADVQALSSYRTVVVVDHEGYHHSEFDWWLFDARESSPKTCELCLALANQMFRGDVVPYVFPYHIHKAVNSINPMVHPNDRCRLRWAGRSEKSYNTPLGILLPMESREIRLPDEQLMRQLNPTLLEQLLSILESPWEL